jgi:hypothetical protein
VPPAAPTPRISIVALPGASIVAFSLLSLPAGAPTGIGLLFQVRAQ